MQGFRCTLVYKIRLEVTILWYHSKGRLQTLPRNVRLGRKCFSVTNTLAYHPEGFYSGGSCLLLGLIKWGVNVYTSSSSLQLFFWYKKFQFFLVQKFRSKIVGILVTLCGFFYTFGSNLNDFISVFCLFPLLIFSVSVLIYF